MCSKRFLTTKVDRSVTGLVAQQQCVGPLQIPIADVGVIAQTHYGITGGATCIGEQPIKGTVNPKAMARMGLGESLTNLVFANTTGLKDIKYSGNWMYAAKLPGDGAHMFDACEALCAAMGELDVAIDGGKDSLSMAARAGGEVVKAPGSVVMSGYVTVPDVTKTVTPDLKLPGVGELMLVEFGGAEAKRRLGGSALAQAFDQVGDASPDMDDCAYFKKAWEATQFCVYKRLISAGHDVSDGGFATAVLEMAFPHPDVGVDVTLPNPTSDAMAALFAEELAIVIEVDPSNVEAVKKAYESAGVTVTSIGKTTADGIASVKVDRRARRRDRRIRRGPSRYLGAHLVSPRAHAVVRGDGGGGAKRPPRAQGADMETHLHPGEDPCGRDGTNRQGEGLHPPRGGHQR